MAQVSDVAVEGLARELAETDGFEWQLKAKLPLPPGVKPPYRKILDDAGRGRYLTLARQRLDQGKVNA
jgi:hypothetical protein